MDEKEKEENPIIRADEVRKMLGNIGKNTLYDWCRQGIIPHRRIGHLLFFSRKAIKEFIENNNKGAI